MNRREYLGTVAGIGAIAAAGCIGGNSGYETTKVAGESVPLAPTDDAYDWYQNDDLAVVDSRSRVAWERTRIEGAVWSPAPRGRETSDPAAEYSEDRRILTYCACPHNLSTQRAATLIKNGYEEVYALDKGINHWIEQGHPIAGENVAQDLPTYEIRGETSPDAAGEEVWVRDPDSGQREPSTIAADGSYEVTFHFVEIDDSTPLTVETPTYEVRAPLRTLTSTVVTPAMA